MTRINVIPATELTDQHLMAEYRELPMVLAAARRSDPARYKATTQYTLNRGHVMFFYDKKKWLFNRYLDLIEELFTRQYDIRPSERVVDFTPLDKFPQTMWYPDSHAAAINIARLVERIEQKPAWYRHNRLPLAPNWKTRIEALVKSY